MRRPPPTRTLPLGPFSDHILIEELKRRGYCVPKKACVKDFWTIETFDVEELDAVLANPDWWAATQTSLARRWGSYVMNHGGLTITQERGTEPGIVVVRVCGKVITEAPQ